MLERLLGSREPGFEFLPILDLPTLWSGLVIQLLCDWEMGIITAQPHGAVVMVQ